MNYFMKMSPFKTCMGILLIMLCVAYTSCSSDRDIRQVSLTDFNFKITGNDQLSLLLDTGEIKKIIVLPQPDSVSTEPLLWSSDNEDVAKVQTNAKGLVAGVLGVNLGTTIIWAYTLDGKLKKSIPVRVIYKVKKIDFGDIIKLSPDSLRMNIVFSPTDATIQDLTWTSSKPDVVSINNGVAVALAPGSSVITATTEEGGKTASKELFVIDASAGHPVFGKAYCTITGYGDYNPDDVTTTGAVQNLEHHEKNIATGNYQYFVGEKLVVKRGSSFTLNLNQSNNWSRSMVWVDWNSDVTFANPDELAVVFGQFGMLNDGPFSKTITVPGNAVLGTTRMRVITGDAWTLDLDQPGLVREPCGEIKNGTIIDFDVDVVQ